MNIIPLAYRSKYDRFFSRRFLRVKLFCFVIVIIMNALKF